MRSGRFILELFGVISEINPFVSIEIHILLVVRWGLLLLQRFIYMKFEEQKIMLYLFVP
jgi:hypothetical protein